MYLTESKVKTVNRKQVHLLWKTLQGFIWNNLSAGVFGINLNNILIQEVSGNNWRAFVLNIKHNFNGKDFVLSVKENGASEYSKPLVISIIQNKMFLFDWFLIRSCFRSEIFFSSRCQSFTRKWSEEASTSDDEKERAPMATTNSLEMDVGRGSLKSYGEPNPKAKILKILGLARQIKSFRGPMMCTPSLSFVYKRVFNVRLLHGLAFSK